MVMIVTCKKLIQICKFRTNDTISWYNILSRKRKKWNLYIASELNNWRCSPTNNFLLKTCLFGRDKLVRNPVKSELIYNGWGTTFDGECYWSCDNDFLRNIASLGVDNTHHLILIIKKKEEVLVLGEGANDDINGSTGAPEKNSINFDNIRNFAKVCITMVIRVTCE